MGRDQAKKFHTILNYIRLLCQLMNLTKIYDYLILFLSMLLMRFVRFQNVIVFIFEPTAQMMLSIIQHLYFFCAFISLELFRQSQSLSITKHLFITRGRRHS